MGKLDWRAIATALALGTVGGALFKELSIPLPWMLGSMCFTTAAAMSGVKVKIPFPMRNVFVTVLGVLLGSSFTPAVVARMHEWVWTMAGLAIWALVSGLAAFFYMRRVAGYDRVTAFFAATPGGLAEMTLIGGQLGGNVQALALSHSVRVMFVVLVVPIWFRIEGMVGPLPAKSFVGLFDVSLADYLVLAACAAAGAAAAAKLRLPAASMIGPMVLSVAVHLTGVTETQPPYVLTAAAQIVLGAAIGQRFAGMRLSQIGMTALHGIVATIIMLGLAVAIAAIFADATGQSLPALVLAYAPGGFAEMSLVALALSVDSALVASHHLFRIAFVVVLAPMIFRRYAAPTKSSE